MKFLMGVAVGIALTYAAALALFMLGDRFEMDAVREEELEGGWQEKAWKAYGS